MRTGLDEPKLRAFIREVGEAAQGPGRVYLVGGATALLLGVREQTVDIELKLDPEPKAIFEGIARIKERLSINGSSPRPTCSCRRSPVGESGASSSRGVGRWSSSTTTSMRKPWRRSSEVTTRTLPTPARSSGSAKSMSALLLELFGAIQPDLIRYPAIDPQDFEVRVREFCGA